MKNLSLFLIKLYQRFFSFDSLLFKRLFGVGNTCRFVPSCSEYTSSAMKKYGIILGSLKGLMRIFRCNPWNKGGFDPVA